MTDKEAYSVTLLMISKLAQDARRLVGRNADKTTDGTGSGSTHAGLSCSISDNNSHRIDDIVSAFEDAKVRRKDEEHVSFVYRSIMVNHIHKSNLITVMFLHRVFQRDLRCLTPNS
jgi:hypothetical protein